MFPRGGRPLRSVGLGGVFVGRCPSRRGSALTVWVPFFLLFLVAASWAPATSWAQPSDPTFVRQDTPNDEVPTEADFLARRFEDAKRLYKQGNYGEAFRLADALLTVAPDVPFRDELKHLRRLAEGRHLGHSLVAVHFEVARGEFPLREIAGFLVLENLTAKTIGVGEKGERQVLGQARYRLTEYYVDGSEWTIEGTKNIVAPSGFELDPGRIKRIKTSIPLPDADRGPVVQSVQVRGSIRPSQFRFEDELVGRSVTWQESRVLRLRDDYEAVRGNPYHHLQIGVLAESSARMVAAVQVLKASLEEDAISQIRREQTIDQLIGALQPNGRLNALLFRLLTSFTGVRCEPRIESWRTWAKRRKESRDK